MEDNQYGQWIYYTGFDTGFFARGGGGGGSQIATL